MSDDYLWKSIGEIVEDRAKLIADRVYLYYYDETYTFSELDKNVNKTANAFRKLGIKRGDKVAIYLVNSPQTLFSFFGAHKLGAAAVPVNTEWREEEVSYLLNHSESKLLICEAELYPIVRHIRKNLKTVENIIVISRANLKPIDREVIDWNETVVREKDTRDFDIQAQLDDMAYIYYTAGTTGRPKGVPLFHKNILSYYKQREAQQQTFSLSGGSSVLPQPFVFMVILPLFHVNAMMTSTMCLTTGMSICLRRRFSATEFWPTIEKYKVNLLSAVPAVYHILLKRAYEDDSWKKYDKSSFFLAITGAAEMPPETIKEFEKVFGVMMTEGYGLTEGTVMSTINPIGERKIGSVGRPAPGQEMRIVDDNGNELPPGQIGEVIIRGENVMKGYYKNDKETKKVIKDGWLYTGDLGYLDSDNYLFLVGRKKDMLIRGGENIYPAEIERVIAQNPKVSEVAVIGVPDKIMGEEAKAYIIAKDKTLTKEEIRKFLEDKLAPHKIPKYISIVDDLPRNPMGKVLKRELREMAKIDNSN